MKTTKFYLLAIGLITVFSSFNLLKDKSLTVTQCTSTFIIRNQSSSISIGCDITGSVSGTVASSSSLMPSDSIKGHFPSVEPVVDISISFPGSNPAGRIVIRQGGVITECIPVPANTTILYLRSFNNPGCSFVEIIFEHLPC